MKKILLLLFCISISTITFSQQSETESQEVDPLIKQDQSSAGDMRLINFKVFPNPTRNSLTVRIGDLSEGITFNIHDVLGKLIYNRKIVSYDLRNNGFKLDMSSFQDGVYMFSLKTKTRSKTIRVVKL